jgi:hypothetical protein
MYNITRMDDGFEFSIAVPKGEQFAGVAITAIDLFVFANTDDGCGDLAVAWDVEGLKDKLRRLHVRGWDDAFGRVMGEFYWDGGYTDRLCELLIAAGVPESVAANVGTSEWGMQDEGRASYDAYELADWVREQAMAMA